MQRVEVRNSIQPNPDNLSVKNRGAFDMCSRIDNQRVAFRPVGAVHGVELNPAIPDKIMYFGIGFLFATLIGVAVIPVVYNRAVGLTLRRLESSLPHSMAEIQADKDLLRAEFAMSRRQLEVRVEELKEQSTSQLAELGRKSDVINRLKIEREVQKVRDDWAQKRS